jgi:WD40 repeat protein
MSEPTVTVELEHAIGFTGTIQASLVYHPNGKDFAYIAGGTVVIGNVKDPHNQSFLNEHDDDISCIAISKSVCVLLLYS